MMAADGFHPSAATYKLWADNVAQVILARRRQIAENAHR
jgi:lysophospholipase L1-like esterase